MAFIESGKGFDKDENHEKMKQRMYNMDSSSYNLRVPTHVYKKVRMKLLQEGKTMKSLINEMLEEYIKIS